MVSTGVALSECGVLFGGDGSGVEYEGGRPALRVALPVLAGDGKEGLLTDTLPPETGAGFSLFRRGGWLAGFGVATAGQDIEAAAAELYGRLFDVTSGRHIYRIWNYVPQINAVTQSIENYRRFCRGRSLAFEDRFGKTFQSMLPSASAVGSAAGSLALGFLAGGAAPRHFENPGQVPAFEYPQKYGPRPPSFSRATVVAMHDERRIFISGTAAIRGHASVANEDLEGQIRCTMENLRIIGETTGAGAGLGAHDGWNRVFKVYLRRPFDLPVVRAFLEGVLLCRGDSVSYLQADICRADVASGNRSGLSVARIQRLNSRPRRVRVSILPRGVTGNDDRMSHFFGIFHDAVSSSRRVRSSTGDRSDATAAPSTG
jgi:hypothetical protein